MARAGRLGGRDRWPPLPSDRVATAALRSEKRAREDVEIALQAPGSGRYAESSEQLDASGVELCVATKTRFKPKTATVFNGFMSVGDAFTLVPANARGHSVTGRCVVDVSEPVHLVTTSPHARRLATHMRFAVQKPGQAEIVMHDAPFSFAEQGSFALVPEVILESGDIVTTTCTYTNPSAQDVFYGEKTSDEMCYNFATYYPMGALRCGGGLLGSLADAF